MTKKTFFQRFFAAGATLFVLAFFPTDADAHYPQISPIGDISIEMNARGPLMRFWVSDNNTLPDELFLTYRSDNPALIPEDDEHITLGGNGQDRTIVITPAPDQHGFANITIIITDKDGDQNREPFQVRVNRPPNT